jgi:hypothetical protein
MHFNDDCLDYISHADLETHSSTDWVIFHLPGCATSSCFILFESLLYGWRSCENVRTPNHGSSQTPALHEA